jgi:hypothetical protein
MATRIGSGVIAVPATQGVISNPTIDHIVAACT